MTNSDVKVKKNERKANNTQESRHYDFPNYPKLKKINKIQSFFLFIVLQDKTVLNL